MVLQNIRKILRLLVPQIFNSFRKNRNIHGDYQSYHQALLASGGMGYVAGNLKLSDYVKSLRDTNDKEIWAWTTLSAILFSTSINKNNNNITQIFDYGGGYGETYFQFREFLSCLNIMWIVVELKDKVAIAKNEGFEGENLKFMTTEDFDLLHSVRIDCLLLGGVLQYTEFPYDLLKNILKKKPSMVALDRTPVLDGSNNEELFYIQEAPDFLGGSAHPLRIINRQNVENSLKDCGYKEYGEYDYGAFPRDYSKGRYVAQIWKLVLVS